MTLTDENKTSWVQIESVPLKTQPHFVGQSMQQKHRLPPRRVDLVPLHGNAGKSTQSEVVDGTKLAAVPGKYIYFLLSALIFFFLITRQTKMYIFGHVCTRCEMLH